MYVSPVMTTKVQEVHWEADPQVNARNPDQDCVLKALGEVWIFCVPCQIPILGEKTDQVKEKANSKLQYLKKINNHYLA